MGAEFYLRRQDHAYNRDRWFHEEYDGAHPYIVFHNRSGWELMPGYSVAGIRINDYGFRGTDFPRRKDPEAVRIMCLGDSCTFGAPGDDSPYPYQLERQLEGMDLEREHQVINAGVDDHASINAQLRLPRLLAFEPDILIVYIGWNDMWLGNPKHYPDMRRKTQSYWHYGNGGDTGLRLLDQGQGDPGSEYPAAPSASFDLEDFLPENYEYNMRRLIRTAKKRPDPRRPDDPADAHLPQWRRDVHAKPRQAAVPEVPGPGRLRPPHATLRYLRCLDPPAGHGRGHRSHRP